MSARKSKRKRNSRSPKQKGGCKKKGKGESGISDASEEIREAVQGVVKMMNRNRVNNKDSSDKPHNILKVNL